MDKRQEVYSQAEGLFLKYGVKSVTMDDIASHMGISKKTLYQFFENKSDLVEKTLAAHLEIEKKAVLDIKNRTSNAIEEIFELGEHVSCHLQTVNPSILFDLKRYYQKAWSIMEDHKNIFIYEHILNNIERGKLDNLYREDINADAIARIYLGVINMLIQPEFQIEQKEIVEYYREYLRYHVRGIASKKGFEVLEALNNKDL